MELSGVTGVARLPIGVVRAPFEAARTAVRDRLERRLVDAELAPMEVFSGPAGDPGLFGPDSVTWQVHSDLVSMLVGGVCALMLQALHPLVMAGVAEHSQFRRDPLGRLQRTAAFVGVTTYGSTDAAMEAIETVRRVHTYVHGTAPDGRPYDATDPELLSWVHTTETASFLLAAQRYSGLHLPGEDVDRYYLEMAGLAERLGAPGVPSSRATVASYFSEARHGLLAGAQALTALAFIVNGGNAAEPGPEDLVRGLIVQAAIDLLPGWARSMYGIRPTLLPERLLVRQATASVATGLRALLGPSMVLEMARRRCDEPMALAACRPAPSPAGEEPSGRPTRRGRARPRVVGVEHSGDGTQGPR